jgi:prepilin-type N-terminal cleavage/methylation domain-containing protein
MGGLMKRRRGFTLVEMCVAMVIIGIILGFAALLFGQVVRHFAKTQMDLDSEREARLSMAEITKEIRQAMPDLRADVLNTDFCDLIDATGTINDTNGAQPAIQCTRAVDIPDPQTNGWLPTQLNYETIVIKRNANNSVGETITPIYGANAGVPSTRTLGIDVTSLSFAPEPCSNPCNANNKPRGTYTVTLTVSPPHRVDVKQIYNGIQQPYTLQSKVYVTYFKA